MLQSRGARRQSPNLPPLKSACSPGFSQDWLEISKGIHCSNSQWLSGRSVWNPARFTDGNQLRSIKRLTMQSKNFVSRKYQVAEICEAEE